MSCGFLLFVACFAGPEAPPPDGEVLYSLLAVGDTGRTTRFPRLAEGQISVARGMLHEHDRDPIDTLVLLGDNFYWNGLTRENLVNRLQQNLALPYCPLLALDGPRSAVLESYCDHLGGNEVQIFAVLGNHDLRSEESAELQRTQIPEFITNWHMSDGLVEVVQLEHGISLILFESELQLTQDLPLAALTRAIASSAGPWRIIASHRPIGMGERGVPSAGGFPTLVLQAIRAARQPVHLYLAGHEHNLQILRGEPGGPNLIAIAGSGSRASTPLAPPLPATRFGARRLGFLRVDLVRSDAAAADERLVVSLFATPRFPVLAWGPPEFLTRFSLALDGELREVPR